MFFVLFVILYGCGHENQRREVRMVDNRALIQSSLDYIEENLKTEITAQELAAHANFSLFHYYRLFLRAVGVPVMQYISRRKLLHAIYEISRLLHRQRLCPEAFRQFRKTQKSHPDFKIPGKCRVIFRNTRKDRKWQRNCGGWRFIFLHDKAPGGFTRKVRRYVRR